MKKNCIFIKSLGLLEPSNDKKNGPFDCLINFQGGESITTEITFCCAEFDGVNYTPINFPQINKNGGLPNYGQLDFSSSNISFLQTNPITSDLDNNFLKELGTTNTTNGVEWKMSLTISKSHLSTDSEKKVLRLRFVPLEATALHNGFYAGSFPNDTSYQNILFRKKVEQDKSFGTFYGLPFVELSFYLYEKAEVNINSFVNKKNTSEWDFATCEQIMFITKVFSDNNNISFYNNTPGAKYNAMKLVFFDNSSVPTETNSYGNLKPITITNNNNTYNIQQVDYSKLPTNKRANLVVTSIGYGENNIEEKRFYLEFQQNYTDYEILAGKNDIQNFISTKIKIEEGNHFNIIDNFYSNPKITKGITYINVIPFLEKTIFVGSKEFSLTRAPYYGGALPPFIFRLDSTSSDKDFINALKTFFNIKCKLIETTDTSIVLDEREGFGELQFDINGSLNVNSIGHVFYNLNPSEKTYEVIYEIEIQNNYNQFFGKQYKAF